MSAQSDNESGDATAAATEPLADQFRLPKGFAAFEERLAVENKTWNNKLLFRKATMQGDKSNATVFKFYFLQPNQQPEELQSRWHEVCKHPENHNKIGLVVVNGPSLRTPVVLEKPDNAPNCLFKPHDLERGTLDGVDIVKCRKGSEDRELAKVLRELAQERHQGSDQDDREMTAPGEEAPVSYRKRKNGKLILIRMYRTRLMCEQFAWIPIPMMNCAIYLTVARPQEHQTPNTVSLHAVPILDLLWRRLQAFRPTKMRSSLVLLTHSTSPKSKSDCKLSPANRSMSFLGKISPATVFRHHWHGRSRHLVASPSAHLRLLSRMACHRESRPRLA